MKKSAFFILGILVVLFFTACPTEPKDLPVNTIRWQSDGSGFTQFYTNDPQYYDYGFWAHFVDHSENETFEIELKRISGYNHVGYGMIFGADNASTTRHYVFLITNTGYYYIYSRDNSTYKDITTQENGNPWIYNPSLINAGNNQINKLKVTRNGNEYTAYINNTEVIKFTDATVTGGNRYGPYAGVGLAANEDFPNTPVDLRFRRIP